MVQSCMRIKLNLDLSDENSWKPMVLDLLLMKESLNNGEEELHYKKQENNLV